MQFMTESYVSQLMHDDAVYSGRGLRRIEQNQMAITNSEGKSRPALTVDDSQLPKIEIRHTRNVALIPDGSAELCGEINATKRGIMCKMERLPNLYRSALALRFKSPTQQLVAFRFDLRSKLLTGPLDQDGQ